MASLLSFESLVLIVAGSLVFAGVLTWSYSSFQNIQNETSEASSELVDCSQLNVRFVDQIKNDTHFTVYFQASQPVEELLIEFEGASKERKIVNDVETNKIYSSTVEMEDIEQINARVKECGTVTTD